MEEAEMELPECPVCLQPYDERAAVPRVLACGHSACEQCLAALPLPRQALPDSVRCPACTQLVPFPRSLGPAALPKNIDLLRFSSSSSAVAASSAPNPKLKPSPTPEFFSLPWTRRPLYSAWKDSILPRESLSIVSDGARSDLLVASVASPLGRPWFMRERQLVSLFPVNGGASYAQEAPGWLQLSYTARVIEVLSKLENVVRDELRVIIDAGFKERRGLCKLYGLWMDTDEENSQLYLVSEKLDRNLSIATEEELKGFNGVADGRSSRFLMIAKELSEVIMGLHSQGIICGCLVPSCFCFDGFGHCLLDLNKVLITGRRVWEYVGSFASRGGGSDNDEKEARVEASPEVFMMLHDKDASKKCGFEDSAGYTSDVWSLAYILVILLRGDISLPIELPEGGKYDSITKTYDVWKEKVVLELKGLLTGIQFDSLLQVLILGLSCEPRERPQVSEIWHCIQNLSLQSSIDHGASADLVIQENQPVCCLVLGRLCSAPKRDEDVAPILKTDKFVRDSTKVGIVESNENDACHLQKKKVEGEFVEAQDGNGFKSITLHGHYDCITGLAVGGGFLFSSSFDKAIKVWSLQDFSHLRTLKGHEHRVTAIIAVDEARKPLCISADSGSGIFLWDVGRTVVEEPWKKWYDNNDWRFSGIHSLAVSETGFLYSGSGDKTIKAWSLQDYSLSCTMTGHKSTISSLAVADGILYSGSWDGTIRLWWLHDHSPLTVLGDDTPESYSPVLSIALGNNLLAASYENGFLKIWRNDDLVRSEKTLNGAIFALHVYNNWLFTGGWEKKINIQEMLENDLEFDCRTIASIACDSVVTCLLYHDSKLVVGLSSRDIKVFYHES